MYTNSIDSEMEFLLALSKSSSDNMKHGEIVEVRLCPNCEKGVVITRCIQKGQNKKFEHYCKECGEIFSISKIKAEVFFNKQNWMLKELKTPVGDFAVKLNNEPFSFKYGVHVYESKTEKKSIMVNKMSIDLSKLKIGDVLKLGFNEDILKLNSVDDNAIMYFCEGEKVILGFCLYLPQKISSLKVKDIDNKGITCEIISDVSSNEFIDFAIVCVKPSDYKDVHNEIILAFNDTIN